MKWQSGETAKLKIFEQFYTGTSAGFGEAEFFLLFSPEFGIEMSTTPNLPHLFCTSPPELQRNWRVPRGEYTCFERNTRAPRLIEILLRLVHYVFDFINMWPHEILNHDKNANSPTDVFI